MKTSGVPPNQSNQPADNKTTSSSKPAQKGKAQKEFKQVLQDSGKGVVHKKKHFPPLEKKNIAIDHPPAGQKHGTKITDPKMLDQERAEFSEKEISPKLKKHGETDPAASGMMVHPNPNSPGIQADAEVANVQRPGLNINEIQSIVNKVQVGINEKGLPECRFEVETKNLGTLDLKVSAEKDQIRIEFVTEDNNAQQVLEQNLKELSQMLQDKGLTLAETKFTPRDQQDSDQQQQSSDGDSQDAYPPLSPTGRKRTFSL
jgi:flagellar hook-length control protein FliK